MKGRFWYYVVISCVTIIDDACCKFGMIIPLLEVKQIYQRKREETRNRSCYQLNTRHTVRSSPRSVGS
jgi:hypothetical protein